MQLVRLLFFVLAFTLAVGCRFAAYPSRPTCSPGRVCSEPTTFGWARDTLAEVHR